MIKTAVITGFSGFIGTTFTMQLLKRGWKVYGIDKFTHVSNNKLIKQKHENFSFENKDIRQVEWLPECDVIFNFAAESDVDIGNQSCDRFIKSNIDGVRNLLDIINNRIILRSDKPLFFQISTDEVYGDMGASNKYAADEGHPLRPSSYYSATKTAADLLVLSAHRTYGLPYLITRSCNNFGPKQDKEKFLPTIFNSIKEGKKIPVYGDGKQIREWISVDDNVRNIAALMLMKSIKNTIVNIGSGFRYHNIDIVKMVGKFLGKEVEFEFVKDRLGHDFKYALDCSKLRAIMPDLIYTALETFLESEAKKCQI